MNKTVSRKRQYITNNAVESIKEMGKAVVGSLGTDLGKGIVSDASKHWEQFLGINKKGRSEASGDLTEGEELNLSLLSVNQPQEEKEEFSMIRGGEVGVKYHREMREGTPQLTEDQEIKKRLEENILIEIRQLAKKTTELEIEFREVTVEQRIVSPGKYHLNFFEWLLSAIKLARMKVEDSGAWLSASKGKKAKKDYWSMFKKHGTTFGLSNERVVATQTG